MSSKTRKSPTLSHASVAKWASVFAQMAEDAKSGEWCPHVGMGNAKTRAVNEGTLPIVTCLHGEWHDWTAEGVERGIAAGIIPVCARFCYAVRMAYSRPNVAKCYARNTAARRIDAWQYYRTFFSHARRDGNLRLNESGDFETADQAGTAMQFARMYPSVRVWGYTQQNPDWVKDQPKNCRIRISAGMDQDRAEKLMAEGHLVTRVTEDESKVNCLAQLKDGWTCADCAKRGIGCCGGCRCITFRKH